MNLCTLQEMEKNDFFKNFGLIWLLDSDTRYDRAIQGNVAIQVIQVK